MGAINTLDDLRKEKARLKMVALEQQEVLKEDVKYIKNYLDPKFLLRSIVSPSADETLSGHLLKNTAGLSAGMLANRFLFSNSNMIVKGLVTIAVKSLTTGLLNADGVKTGIKSFLSRFSKNGRSAKRVTT